MNNSSKQETLIEYLSGFVTEGRLNTLINAISFRTKYVTVVLEDIYQSHNASAVLRSCEGFGIQDVHIIENRNKYEINPDVALGSTKWLNLIKYNSKSNNTIEAINNLKKHNYQIVATSPHKKSVKINELNLNAGKIALVFGSEMPGISDYVHDNADEFVYIPMFGLTESFNISVSVALCLYQITHNLRQSDINWQLNSDEQNELLLDYLKKSIKSSDMIIDKYMKK